MTVDELTIGAVCTCDASHAKGYGPWVILAMHGDSAWIGHCRRKPPYEERWVYRSVDQSSLEVIPPSDGFVDGAEMHDIPSPAKGPDEWTAWQIGPLVNHRETTRQNIRVQFFEGIQQVNERNPTITFPGFGEDRGKE